MSTINLKEYGVTRTEFEAWVLEQEIDVYAYIPWGKWFDGPL
jgi:hypothetical protein